MMSCATTNEKSLYFGDIEGNNSKQYYSSTNGFTCFDYSKVILNTFKININL